MTFEEITELAQKVLDGKINTSYVQAAYVLAKVLLRDYKPTLDNLSSTQTRCTELLEENRRLRFATAHLQVLEEHSETFEKLACDHPEPWWVQVSVPQRFGKTCPSCRKHFVTQRVLPGESPSGTIRE